MVGWKKIVLGTAMALVSVPAAAQDRIQGAATPSRWTGSEIVVGLFDHGSNFHPLGEELVFPRLPAGQLLEGEEEKGTVDIQLAYRSAPLRWALKPRLTAKGQINTAGRTSFASVGAEWRQHVLHGRVYGQVGIGLTIHDGYRFTPDPFVPGLDLGEARRRYGIYRDHTSWGSRVLFNPNASLGVRLNARWAAELAWEHFSHRQMFSKQNPGIDHLGLRLVRRLGR
ncbi:acyloxyacyl hydrolase [Sphingomonas montana]|uniref:acyloxyacyl hydrolase n=1 Tax=Sphingomonas montana TaxID=1843236 RepID=UPI00096F1BB3|nr:acyloxyacyl hydrolase [Sphingomonas montana]